MSDTNTKCVVAFGEVLWDCLPRGLFLGGAPLNVAYHTNCLGATSYVASAVGDDFLGEEAFRRIESSGICTRLLKRHPVLRTGASVAELDDSGDATYQILEPVAWDSIMMDEADETLVLSSDALVYGSLAARSAVNLDRLQGLLANTEALKVCDINLRAPFDDLGLARRLASQADLLKVNDDELASLIGSDCQDLELAIEKLASLTGVQLICVTLGKRGASLWRQGEMVSGEPMDIEVADTIGAGDSFTAALTLGVLDGLSLEACLQRALRLSSFVASRSGAQPDYDAAEVLG